MIDVPDTLDLLSHRVEELEKRVSALEHPVGAVAPAVAALVSKAEDGGVEAAAMEQTGNIFPVLGRALLGIAGAYVLRAVAESNALPKLAVAGVAIVYAAAWLVWAAKAKGATAFVRAIYAGTSALILAPMLWELTMQFKVLSPLGSAVVLVCFAAGATGMAWGVELRGVFAIALGTAAVAAFALAVGTHALTPFLAALLLMLLLCEFAVLRDRGQGVWLMVAGVTDAAVLVLIFIYAGPQEARAEYPPLSLPLLLAPACLLFLINGSGIAVRTLALKRTVAVSEILQAILGFALAAASVVSFGAQSDVMAFGLICGALGAGCYVLAFFSFQGSAERRNFQVFGTWSAGLLLIGVLSCLPAAWSSAFLSIAALTAFVLGMRMQCAMMDLHGNAFLVAAAVTARLPQYIYEILAGVLPGKPSLAVLLASACALVCYAIARERNGEAWQQQVLHLIPATIAAFAAAGLLAQGLLGVAALGIVLDVHHVAFVRTLAICAVALALAFSGARFCRLEMTRIAYAALVLAAAKLLFEDLRHGHMEFTAGSIFLFAVTLIAVPRLARLGRRTEKAIAVGSPQTLT